MRPSFLSFYTAKSGIDAARANLQITGQNITNANTVGYTRQRVDLYSVGSGSYNMRYAVTKDSNSGEGVYIGGFSQIRNSFLDVHFRKENAKLGDSASMLEALGDLEDIFDETMQQGLMTQFSDVKTQLENLAQNAGDAVSEKVLQTSCLLLVKMFNQYSDQVQVAKERQIFNFETGGIDKTNALLKNIAYLNGEIKNASVAGNPALELLDQRNMLLDELSGYMNIETVTTMSDAGLNTQAEELSVNLIGANGEKFNLIDNDECRQFELANDADGNVTTPIKIKLINANGTYATASNSYNVPLNGGDVTDQFTTGSFSGYLTMLNSAGEFDDPPSTQRGIGYYDQMLDTLANTFAEVFNKANSTNTAPPYNKPLFEASDGGAIKAGNIAISEKWMNASGSYITSTKEPPTSGTGNAQASDNILAMINLFSSNMKFETSAHVTLFSGTLNECLTNISGTLALQVQSTQRNHDTYTNNVTGIEEQRSSVSGVSLDEEGINLIMYNQALTASSRFMTTLDEALDTIINRMGLVGR